MDKIREIKSYLLYNIKFLVFKSENNIKFLVFEH